MLIDDIHSIEDTSAGDLELIVVDAASVP